MKALKITAAVLLALAVGGFSWLWFAPCGFGGCAPVSELEQYQAEGSQLLDVNGDAFGQLATVNRRIVALDSLPEFLPEAFLAVEDRRFYGHHGVDWKRAMGAMLSNVRAGGVAEGGSTITMQLARNLFPEHLPYRERSFRRKAMEIRVARQIERAFDKQKILELYLNHIYLGEGAYGVDAAARVYFGKPAAELTLAEAAVLGGLPKSPSRINPREDRKAARERRDLVLREMAKAGYVSQAEAEEAIATPIRLAREERGAGAERAGYFRERVRRELEERVGERVYTAGLRVHTTLDPVAQRAAEAELSRQLEAVESGRFGAYRHPTYASAKGKAEDGTTRYLQGMAIVMDAATGEVRALVGGRDFADSKFDRAYQALRQPGSAFKPFVYLAALEQGMAPTHRLEDAPIRMVLTGGQVWEPRNYTGGYAGQMTMREALTRSVNTATVRLSEEVGMGRVIATAREMGLGGDIPNVPAAALGAADVRPIDLVSAYAPLANGGTRVEPHFIRRIEDRHGEVVWEAPESRDQVLDAGVAFVLTSMLRDVVDRGTGTAVRAAGFGGPAAGKTGTTNSAADVWFVGYTPELVGAVWMGLDNPKTIVRGASGGTIAAPVWGRIMRRIYAGRPMPRDWSQPRNVVTEEIDRATGFAVDPACPAQGPTYTEYFVNVRPPRQYCYPDMQYPTLAMDTLSYDYEWGGGAYEPDTVGLSDLEERGVYWPELEEMRRRGQERETPLPGEVAATPPEPGTGTALPGEGGTTTRAPATGGTTARPRGEPPTGAGGSAGGSGSAGSGGTTRREPRVLGKPVEPKPSTPTPPAPATPPDTSSSGGAR